MEKPNNNTSEKFKLAKTHVPDKVYAYSLQVRHSLFELLNCSGDDVVSIEVLDDISTQKTDGSTVVTQVKSVLSDKNPISNRAADLWKTFYNWLLAVKTLELIPDNTKFRIFVAASRFGEIANLFSNAINIETAEKAWEKAKLEFYDERGNEKKLGNEYATYIREFFNPQNKLLACKIIINFNLVTIEDKHTTILYNEFCQKTYTPEDLVENVFTYMIGWIDKRIAELIEHRKPMSISWKSFKAQLIAITGEFNQKLSLKELAPRPTEGEIQNEYNAVRRYIEQLEIINCDYTDKIEAISDYLRASTNRTLWASRGDISETNLEDYQNDLIAKWNNKKNIIKLSNKSLSANEQGKLLFFQCKDNPINIGHLSVPVFFTPGCYHALSDKNKVGWHPEYEELLKIRGEDDEQPE